MKILELLKSKKTCIFEKIQSISVDKSQVQIAPPEIYKSYCVDQSKNKNYYTQYFDTYLLKQVHTVNYNIVKDQTLIDILSNPKILNVFYFEVWGDVVEHKDPPGIHLGYRQNNYKTILMPINIPSTDKNVFETFYNGQSFDLKEGDFFEWDVCKIPHSWKFDYSKVNELFKLLHIDYIE